MTTLTPPTETAPAPGIYPDVPFETYLRWRLMSQSVLKAGRASMSHLKAELDGQVSLEATDSMLLGSALDTAFLEPELMLTKVAVWPAKKKGKKGGDVDNPRKGSKWEAFKVEHAGKVILTECAYEKMQGMVRSLRKHPEVKKWWGRFDNVQCSIVGDLFGVPFKVRLDARTPDPLFDLKMTNDADPRLFGKRAYDLGYHIQAFCYCKLADRKRMVLLTVEEFPPHDVVPYEMDDWMAIGERETVELIDDYKRCQETGIWPGRASKPIRLAVPHWLNDVEEPTHNGKVKIA